MAVEEDDVKEEQVGEAHDAPSHHPSAPHDELFDISTTVDPSYIISLIRKLLPGSSNNDSNHGVDNCDDPNMKTNITEETTQSKDRILSSLGHDCEAMDIVDGVDGSSNQEEKNEDLSPKPEALGPIAEEAWEEYGCVLWDLAASRTHAELMVQNLVLEVLLANLMVSTSVRATEISLGILGNLACHEDLVKHIVSTSGLIERIVDQLFLFDTQCLIEACRLLTSGLQGRECVSWAEALRSEHILNRILWIIENTLNAQLIEKSVGLLLAIVGGRQEVQFLLLPPFMKLGLSEILINLLATEVAKLTGERMPERYAALDVILQVIEALSALDEHSQEICSNAVLLQTLCELIKFSDKAEVASACVTAGVVIANILSDHSNWASEMSGDFPLLQGMFDLFPFASDDLEARSAVWNVIARLLLQVQEDEMSPSDLHKYVSVLVSKSDIIEDDLLDNQLGSGEQTSFSNNSTKSNARTMALKRIIGILNKWTASRISTEENDDAAGNELASDSDVGRLLDCCKKYTEFDDESYS